VSCADHYDVRMSRSWQWTENARFARTDPVNSTLLDFIPKIRRLGNREAIRFHNGFRTWKLTYIELYRRIAALSDHLQDRGVGQDDRLLLWGENRAEWVIAFWASLARGIQVVPLDSRSSDRFVGKIQKEVDAKVLIHGETVNPGSLPLEKLSFSEFEQFGEKDDLQLVGSGPEGIVEIVYTSGTTGTPKGVVHRHRNLCANLRPFKQEINRYRKLVFPFQPIRFLNMLPLSHMFGQAAGLFIPVLLGGAVVFMRELHPGAVIETIHGQRVSVLVAVPRLLSQLQKHIEWKFHVADQAIRTRGMIGVAERWWRFRLVHSELGWKFWAMVVGGARLKPEIEKFWSRLGYLLIQGYGLTEASPIVAVNHPFKTKRGSVGKAIEGQQIKIADDGEILVRGESIASEYLAGSTRAISEKSTQKETCTTREEKKTSL
jgi:long-chain acyl-CoA synthetase